MKINPSMAGTGKSSVLWRSCGLPLAQCPLSQEERTTCSSCISRRRSLFSRKSSSDFGPSVLGFFYDGAADLLSTSRREEHSERNTKADSRSKTDRITHGVVLWPKNRLPRAISEAFNLIFYLLPNWCRRFVRLLQEIQSGFERRSKKFVQVHNVPPNQTGH